MFRHTYIKQNKYKSFLHKAKRRKICREKTLKISQNNPLAMFYVAQSTHHLFIWTVHNTHDLNKYYDNNNKKPTEENLEKNEKKQKTEQ